MKRSVRPGARILAILLSVISTMALGSYNAVASPYSQNGLSSNINVVAGEIHTIGFQTFPDSYGGLKLDSSSSLTVFVSKPDPGLVSRVNGLASASGLRITYENVSLSFQQLVDLEIKIMTTDRPELITLGVTVV